MCTAASIYSSPGDRSDSCISETKSLREEYELLEEGAPSESDPDSSVGTASDWETAARTAAPRLPASLQTVNRTASNC